MEVSVQSLKGFCACGKEHQLEVEKIVIEANAIQQVPTWLKEKNLCSFPMIICDFNTYPLGARELKKLLHLHRHQIINLNPNQLYADEYALQAISKQLDANVSVLIAFGSGTIHDLTRYAANELHIPFVSLPTAASVDGFASTVAAMTFNGFKVTTPAKAPCAIFADTRIISKAPMNLSAAGVADLLAKFTALLDWKVSTLLTDEYYCQRVVELTEEAVQIMIASLEGISSRIEAAFEPLMQGLILSGLGMQMVGNSRPASGAEHHLSHLWEMHIINDEIDALHGEKVGVGLLLVSEAYHQLLILNEPPRFQTIDLYQEEMIKPYFKNLSGHVLKEHKDHSLKQVSEERVADCFKEIQALIEQLPSVEQLKVWIQTVGGKTTLSELGLPEELKDLSLKLAPYVRNRLTLLKLMNQFDLEN